MVPFSSLVMLKFIRNVIEYYLPSLASQKYHVVRGKEDKTKCDVHMSCNVYLWHRVWRLLQEILSNVLSPRSHNLRNVPSQSPGHFVPSTLAQFTNKFKANYYLTLCSPNNLLGLQSLFWSLVFEHG